MRSGSAGVREKLTATLRSWLLHHGRRERIAAELFVHPQTVRYRMGQLRDLRTAVLAPLDGVSPSVREKLTATLRSWLLHHGRREQIAAELFVHPQTVRYRMGQLRDLFGDRLEDPQTVLALTIALGAQTG